MRARPITILGLGLAVLLGACRSAPTPTTATGIVPRPEQLHLPPLRFAPPDPTALRFELGNGIPVYAMEDHELPLVTVSVLFRGGASLEPDGREGLAELTAALWPAGGAGSRSAADLDDELDRLAADVTAEIGADDGSLTLDVLSRQVEPATLLLMDIIGRPRFEPERFDQAKADILQALRSRNDDPARVEEREWSRLVYGPAYWSNRLATPTSVDAIAVQDCHTLVATLVRAGNLVVAVAGDFDRPALRALLERTLGSLPRLDRPLPPLPQPEGPAQAGVWVLDRPETVQSRVRIGQLGLRMGDPDELALLAVNEVLGGGFSSRLVRRIRSEEGLAYDVSSAVTFPAAYPGTFEAAFQTKPSTCAFAASIALETMRDLRRNEVSDDELALAKSALLARATEQLGSAAATVLTLARDELDGRPAGYWVSYRERVAALTAADLRAAAERHLDPQRMVVLVIGDRARVDGDHPEHPVSLADLGPVHTLPARDPLTLEPVDAQPRPPGPLSDRGGR